MKVLLLHQQVPPTADAAERDVLVQAESVVTALRQLGHSVDTLACSLDLEPLDQRLERDVPDVVFNLVESLGGRDGLMPLVTLLLESRDIPFTGNGTDAIRLSINKLLTKRRLVAEHLPTPAWFDRQSQCWIDTAGSPAPYRAIIKAVSEHASFGMTDASVVDLRGQSPAGLAAAIERVEHQTGRPHLGAGFVDGRAGNLSLLMTKHGVQVLPPAEILFADFPAGKPRIVGYEAKWDEQSLAYQQTPRSFDFLPADESLLQQLADLARQCWQVSGLAGYARVDFRVDEHGQPWVLEWNANPCLAPDAGFAAAAARGGWSFTQIVDAIVHAAMRGD